MVASGCEVQKGGTQMGVKKTHQQFLDEIMSKEIPVHILGTYINSQTPLSCKCNKCGLVWEIRPNNLLRGYGCPKCGIEKRAQSQSKDNTDFVTEMSKINPQITIQEEYKGARQPIMCKCNVCGHTWKAAPTNLLKGKGCPVCARKIIADKNRRSHSEFLETIQSFGHNIEPLEQFKGNSEPIKMKCNTCGYRWTTTASSIVYGSGCPRCAGNGIYTQEEFVRKLYVINPFVEVVGEYQRSAIPVKCKCLRCGHIWTVKPNGLLNGSGCPKCYHSTTSFIEQVIFEVFGLILGKEQVLSRNRSAIGKELDIYIPAMKLAIEPGSWKWHESKVKNDRSKRELCSKLGVRLITIYSDYNDARPPFDEDCLCVKETLGFENDLQALQNLIKDLLRLANIDYEISSSQWACIIKTAYDSSRRITTDEFKNKVLSIHNDVVVVGEYTGAWNKIRCECTICGHSWSPTANSLLQGHGCPKCASANSGKAKRKSHSQFESELHSINPQVKLLSKYEVSTQKVMCQCNICGHEWSLLPGNLLKGKGCPKCARKRK